MIRIKRAYEEPAPEDGQRILVDRLWPRGRSKEALRLTEWLRDVSPSNALRKTFHGHPDHWDEFCEKYFAELESNPEPVRHLKDLAGRSDITLLYAAKDEVHNNAVALKKYLEQY